jgi:hypothetical protein
MYNYLNNMTFRGTPTVNAGLELIHDLISAGSVKK